jgi:hypothetical protein
VSEICVVVEEGARVGLDDFLFYFSSDVLIFEFGSSLLSVFI